MEEDHVAGCERTVTCSISAAVVPTSSRLAASGKLSFAGLANTSDALTVTWEAYAPVIWNATTSSPTAPPPRGNLGPRAEGGEHTGSLVPDRQWQQRGILAGGEVLVVGRVHPRGADLYGYLAPFGRPQVEVGTCFRTSGPPKSVASHCIAILSLLGLPFGFRSHLAGTFCSAKYERYNNMRDQRSNRSGLSTRRSAHFINRRSNSRGVAMLISILLLRNAVVCIKKFPCSKISRAVKRPRCVRSMFHRPDVAARKYDEGSRHFDRSFRDRSGAGSGVPMCKCSLFTYVEA